jgi:hypothetical protein
VTEGGYVGQASLLIEVEVVKMKSPNLVGLPPDREPSRIARVVDTRDIASEGGLGCLPVDGELVEIGKGTKGGDESVEWSEGCVVENGVLEAS